MLLIQDCPITRRGYVGLSKARSPVLLETANSCLSLEAWPHTDFKTEKSRREEPKLALRCDATQKTSDQRRERHSLFMQRKVFIIVSVHTCGCSGGHHGEGKPRGRGRGGTAGDVNMSAGLKKIAYILAINHTERACVLERSDPETHGRAARVHYGSGRTRSPANACVC